MILVRRKEYCKSMQTCFYCGHELIWGGNNSRDEMAIDDKEGIVDNLSCPHCGAFYEAYQTPFEDEEHYPYFKDRYEQRRLVDASGIDSIDFINEDNEIFRMCDADSYTKTYSMNGIVLNFSDSSMEFFIRNKLTNLKEVLGFMSWDAEFETTGEDNDKHLIVRTTNAEPLFTYLKTAYKLSDDTIEELSGAEFIQLNGYAY